MTQILKEEPTHLQLHYKKTRRALLIFQERINLSQISKGVGVGERPHQLSDLVVILE